MSQPQFAKFTSSCLKKKKKNKWKKNPTQILLSLPPSTLAQRTQHEEPMTLAGTSTTPCSSCSSELPEAFAARLLLLPAGKAGFALPCRQHTSWSLQAKRRASLPTRFAHRRGDHRFLPLTSEPISPAPAKGTACAEVPSPACIPGSCLKGSLFHLHSWG